MLTLVGAEAVGLVGAGPFVGSFLGTVIDRSPKGEGFLWSRSRCDSCRVNLGIGDLVPLVSFLVLRGRCRACHAAIPVEPLAIETSFIIVTGLTVAFLPASTMALGAALAWWLLALSWFDALQGRLPNLLTLPLGIVGLVVATMTGMSFLDRVIGAVAGLALPASAAWVYRRTTARDGLGMGDVKLFGAAGAWLGWQLLPSLVLFSSVSALCFLFAMGANAREPLRFGPFIAVTTWTLWIIAQRKVPS